MALEVSSARIFVLASLRLAMKPSAFAPLNRQELTSGILRVITNFVAHRVSDEKSWLLRKKIEAMGFQDFLIEF